ncbi:MAG: hypothetical protein JWR12_2409 [Mucilaginibacter sp.]|nr:hypothetical protein [Mucilaginibacter sp.]
MLYPTFKSAKELACKIDAYFNYIEGEYHLESIPAKGTKQTEALEQKVMDREAEPATITGLALHLGFSSRQAFDDYEQTGRFATAIKRGRLLVEAVYEKKLHQSPAGAMFALKNIGWKEKVEEKPTTGNTLTSLKIEIIETGPKPVESEKEVVL